MCAVVSAEDARAVDRSQQPAEFRRDAVTTPYLGLYPFAVTHLFNGRDHSILGLLLFQPMLPHRGTTCTSGG